MATKIHPVLVSRNVKTGPIPTTMTEAKTCPDTCPFKGSGCYAEVGHTGMNWRKVSSGERGMPVEQFAEWVGRLPLGTFWRHNVAGDLPGDGKTINKSELADIVWHNRGRRGFTYTHYPVEGPEDVENRDAVDKCNRHGFTVNLSANNPAHADELAKLDIGPVVSVVGTDLERGKEEALEDYRERVADIRTPEGRKVVICPATYSEATCQSCQLCQRKRKTIVGFPAHGPSKRKADAVVQSYEQKTVERAA